MKIKKISKLEKWLCKKLFINHKKAKLFLILASISMLSSSIVLMTLALENYNVLNRKNSESVESRIKNTQSLTFTYE